MSRIENLGDYNDLRIALQKVGGKKELLYKMIGDAAVAKETPKLLFKGGVIGGTIVAVAGGAVWAGKKGIDFLKDRKKKIESEPVLKEEFDKMVEAELAKESE